MTTYKQAAEQGFNRLVILWNHAKPFYATNGGCFWMCGNTLHVALDYLIAVQQRDTYKLIEDAFSLFDNKVTDPDPKNWYNEGIWVDDYGWWGIALTRAYIFAETLGYNDSLKDKLGKYANNCWIGMHTAWDPSVMQNDDPNVHISGGIWNSRQSTSYLAGRNCVTNEVYWLLCHYLSVAIGNQFMDPNTDEAVWFSQAKASNVLFDDNKLVLERFKGSPGGVKGYNWLGDQGLFLYGCYRNSDPKAPNLNLTQAEATIQAVSDHKTTNKVLSEPLFSDSAFFVDYAGGKGIFMRNLGYLNDDSHAGEPLPRYDEWIMDNAAAVWNNQLPNGNFHYWWERKQDEEDISWGYPLDVVDAVLHASGQSALTACIPHMENQTIPTTASGVSASAP
jgi:hypothetical protein